MSLIRLPPACGMKDRLRRAMWKLGPGWESGLDITLWNQSKPKRKENQTCPIHL